MKELTIKRSEWWRGHGTLQHSALAVTNDTLENADEKKSLKSGEVKFCCLGLLGRSCGVPVESMIGVGLPNNVSSHVDKFPEPVASINDNLVAQITETNDSSVFGHTKVASEADREQKLIDLFAQFNYKLTFVD